VYGTALLAFGLEAILVIAVSSSRATEAGSAIGGKSSTAYWVASHVV
jgi:hypothetical protein